MHRVCALRFHANDLAARPQALYRVGNAPDEAAATDRDDYDIEVLALFADFEPNSSRPKRNLRPLERVNEIPLLVVLYSFREFECLVHIVREHYLGAV